ncbi:hypothetical protein MPLSOD_10336 [Mesorhizobium sp. SOD10]|nr:hypothetical protein MPLSOD_10336 [Mesorhizobium sp. SOD10]
MTGKFGQLPRGGRADISGAEYAGKTLLALDSRHKRCLRVNFLSTCRQTKKPGLCDRVPHRWIEDYVGQADSVLTR